MSYWTRFVSRRAFRVTFGFWLLIVAGCAGSSRVSGPAESGGLSPSPQGASEEQLAVELDKAIEKIEHRPTRETASLSRSGPRAWLGVQMVARAARAPGVQVDSVVRGSPAAQAGLRTGDVILSLEGRAMSSPRDVVRFISRQSPGQRVGMVIDRSGQQRLTAVRLTAFPGQEELLRMSYLGAPAPRFESLQSVQGSVPPSLSALRGKVVVLEFWAPWCSACRMLIPTLNRWWSGYSSQGVAVVGVTTDPVPSAALSARELKMKYAIFSDRKAHTSRAYQAMAVPMVLIIDQRGVVRDLMIGYNSRKLMEMEALIHSLLERG